ncbi:MAG: Holliday junction branch migration DNA helicase RuvB [Patescibacteria group bacterium]|jgi:Holliday junction DNA helicase RuvB|nr:Holliday junction branch migration DNA helicase RuvB [Patescibacteria group bacterium]
MSKFKEQNIIAPEDLEEDKTMDRTLRPRNLKEFIGQKKLKDNLKIFVEAAKQRGESLDHVLFYGPPGLGKTTLSYIIANEMGVNIRITSGPTMDKVGDLAAILTNLENGDILFIDEIHRLSKVIEEVLYPAMEEYGIDLVVGKGPMARNLRLDLPRFTLIGATTRPSLLSAPLRDRFGLTHQLDFYQNKDIEEIINRSARILKIEITPETAEEIAKRSRFTPRVANRLLKRVRDFAQVDGQKIIEKDFAIKSLGMLEIDELGLNQMDRKILATIIDKFAGGPVGLKTLAMATSEDLESVEEIYEPYLTQLGFLKRTPRGRMATEGAYKHLGYKTKLI